MIKLAKIENSDMLIKCGGRRGPKGNVTCEKPALHRFGCTRYGRSHAGRGRTGQWFFWIGPWSTQLRR